MSCLGPFLASQLMSQYWTGSIFDSQYWTGSVFGKPILDWVRFWQANIGLGPFLASQYRTGSIFGAGGPVLATNIGPMGSKLACHNWTGGPVFARILFGMTCPEIGCQLIKMKALKCVSLAAQQLFKTNKNLKNYSQI